MSKSFSITEARLISPHLVHQLDRQPRIQLTRRGKPVAVLLSVREYDRLMTQRQGFWGTYSALTEITDLQDLEIEPQVFCSRT